jgi:hypothetical protein
MHRHRGVGPYWNAMLRTTCVATHDRWRPRPQSALSRRASKANVNCRILPGRRRSRRCSEQLAEQVADPPSSMTSKLAGELAGITARRRR